MDEQKRPNFLWIMTDQQKANTLSCTWKNRTDSPWIKMKQSLTPNLDSLADDGTLFCNAYCPSPVCAPARACMKTGKYPAANGVIGNWMPFRTGQRFLPEILKESGYDTGMVGKLHFFPPENDYGFQERHLSDAPYSVYADDDKHSEYIKWLRQNFFDKKGIDPVKIFDEDELSYDNDIKRFCMGSCFRSREEHEAVWTTDLALDYLRRRKGEKPFFFYASYFGPHQPYGAPEPYASLFSPEDIKLPESFYLDEKRGEPVFEQTGRELRRHITQDMSERDCKELIAAYLGQVAMLDEEIGRLLKCLKEEGLYENTVIIFTSDHGEHLGDHGLFFKSQMYDSCTKVPLIIKTAGNHSIQRREEVVNTMDLFRTVLELGGIGGRYEAAHDEEIESRSLTSLLAPGKAEWENTTYSIVGKKKESLSCMIRDGDWKLLRFGGAREKAVYEMYCVERDPEERKNLYGKKEYCEIQRELKDKLEFWFEKQYRRYED